MKILSNVKFVKKVSKTNQTSTATSKMFMEETNTYINVIYAQNGSTLISNYKLTSIPLTKVTKVSNVTLVENHSLIIMT